jgi:hypothetical protein
MYLIIDLEMFTGALLMLDGSLVTHMLCMDRLLMEQRQY